MSKTTIPTGGITADAIDATLIADDAISEEHLDATAITGHTALAEAPADTDEFLISDGGTLKRIDASHIGGGRSTLLSTTTISSDSNVTFNNSLITSTYDNYLITIENVITGSGNIHLEMHASTDNGSSYETSSGDYRKISFNGIENESNNGFTSRYGTNEDDIRITGNYANNGNDAALKIDATIQCFTLNSSSYKKFLVHSIFGQTDDPPKLVYENAVHLFDGSQSAVNNLRIQASSGTLASGKIKLFGLA